MADQELNNVFYHATIAYGETGEEESYVQKYIRIVLK